MPENPRYRIIITDYSNYQRIWCETALALYHSFQSLNLECDIAMADVSPNDIGNLQFPTDRINILLGYQWLKVPPNPGVTYIPYQFELLRNCPKPLHDRVRPLLTAARQVWDYSPDNIAALREWGIHAKYLPIGYHENLCTIPEQTEKDIDVFFYGYLSPRRLEFIRHLRERTTLKVEVASYQFGRERDSLIARSRIVVAVHQWEGRPIMGTTRIAYLLNNACFFLLETCASNAYDKLDLKFGSRDQLIELCQYYAAHPQEAQQLGQHWRDQFRQHYPMTDLLQGVLAGLQV